MRPFLRLACHGPGQFILAQFRPGPEKYGPNSTHRDEFGLHFSLARPGLAWPGPYKRSFLRLARHGPGRSILAQVWPGPEKNGPNSSLSQVEPSFFENQNFKLKHFSNIWNSSHIKPSFFNSKISNQVKPKYFQSNQADQIKYRFDPSLFPPHDNCKNMQTWNLREETANHMGIWLELSCTILLISLLPCMTCMQWNIRRQKILHCLSIYSGTSNMQYFYPYSTWWSVCTMLQILSKCEVKASFCWQTIPPPLRFYG